MQFFLDHWHIERDPRYWYRYLLHHNASSRDKGGQKQPPSTLLEEEIFFFSFLIFVLGLELVGNP
jgi:hypothetical protein